MMRILSVNVAREETIVRSGRSATTGIFKRPAAGPVRVTTGGLEGDAIIERRHHGGPDQAVYVYGQPDYEWWSRELGQTLAPGTFGDNLTITELDTATLHIGDHLCVGDEVVLEVTAPRLPCSTLAARMGDKGFVARFRDAERPGVYCRVLAEGDVEAGAPVRLESASDENTVTALEMFRSYYDKATSVATVRRILAAPIAVRARKDYEKKLAAMASDA